MIEVPLYVIAIAAGSFGALLGVLLFLLNQNTLSLKTIEERDQKDELLDGLTLDLTKERMNAESVLEKIEDNGGFDFHRVYKVRLHEYQGLQGLSPEAQSDLCKLIHSVWCDAAFAAAGTISPLRYHRILERNKDEGVQLVLLQNGIYDLRENLVVELPSDQTP